jgi:anti-anti-sigma factor
LSKQIVITLPPVINRSEAEAFVRELHEAEAAPEAVIILDCRRVEYLNSRAVSALVESCKNLSCERRLRLVEPGDFMLKTLEVVGLLSLLDVYPSLAEAEVE